MTPQIYHQTALDHYFSMIRRKARRAVPRGLAKVPALNDAMFSYQADVTDYLLRVGCGAGFLDTGMGKALIGLEWGRVIGEATNKPVLMLAPLAVGPQHAREAARFGIDAAYVRDATKIKTPIVITNYERMHLFDPDLFGGLVCDESSVVKSFGGKTSKNLMAFAERIPYVLALTATPAPNDHMELGQHSQLLRVMASNEMLARWFVADQSQKGRYRLKHHGVADFWSWVAGWARMAAQPSDLGYSDVGFERPGHQVDLHYVDADLRAGAAYDELFRHVDTSATAIHKEKRITAKARAERIAEIVKADPNETWLVWCDTDYEADALSLVLPEAVEVRGSDSSDYKEAAAMWFCGIEGECTCGNQSTQKIANENYKPSQMQVIQQSLNLAEPQKKTQNTCTPTTERIKISGLGQRNKIICETSIEEDDTQNLQNCEKKPERKPLIGEKETQKSDSQMYSSLLGSPSNSTMQCTSLKMESVQSAEEIAVAEDCESIIVIQQEKLGDYSATHAISGSESLAIRQSLSKKLCYTCELQKKKTKILITKASIFGFGLNFQHCARVAFCGLSFSYEQYYQAIRRCDRFGQTRKVQVHVALAETESVIWNTIQRKAHDHETMKAAMTAAMRREVAKRETKTAYIPRQIARLPQWLAA